jgi:iron complex transport system substrate-binding protein
VSRAVVSNRPTIPGIDDLTWHEIVKVEDLTRRQIITSAFGISLLVACGASPTATPLATTKSITHEFGIYQIPLSPSRVVALDGRPGFEATLALGFKPIAVGKDALVEGKLAPFISFDMTGVQITDPNQVNFEALASLSPDLIIGRDFQLEKQRDKLAAIAPILPIRLQDTWRDALLRLADWLGRRTHVDAELAKYDATLAPVKERHASRIAAAKVGVLQYTPEETSFYNMRDGVQFRTMLDLGGTEHQFLTSLPKEKPSFSLEQLSKLEDIDAILLISFGDAADKLRQEPVWQRLPAVAAGHVVETDIRTTYGGVYVATSCIALYDRLYGTLA